MTRRLAVVVTAALGLGGCIDYLPPGEHGIFRYFTEVRGEVPLPMLPPITDRDGNSYVLYGAPDLVGPGNLQAFAGNANGGWNSGCSILRFQEISLGARTWIGTATSRAWYWAGEGLVEMSGRTGSCKVVLPQDPATNANIVYLGVIPRIYETPSRTFAHALIRGGNDVLHVAIDLDRDNYGDARPFEPTGATDIRVLGTGTDRERNIGYMLVSYELEGSRVVEGIHLDRENREIARGRVDVSGELAEALDHGAVLGDLQSVDGALVAGYLETGDVVLFDRGGGTIQTVPEMSARGVHRWDGEVYAVGVAGEQPVLARINSDASFGAVTVWDASLRTAARLNEPVRVLDDRREPRRVVAWETASTASGQFPFVQPWSPQHYAEETTGWVIAGPSFQGGSGIPQTSIAFGPIGISYP